MELIRGTKAEVSFTAVDADGVGIDFTSSARTLLLRLTLTGASTPALTRTTGVSGEASWTTQTLGTGKFLFSTTVTAALTAGKYTAEVIYGDTGVTDKKRVYGPTVWTVVTPGTGSL